MIRNCFSQVMLTVVLVAGTILAKAQQSGTDDNQRLVMDIGSAVLKQTGTSTYSYNNSEYFYEKIWEAPGITKNDLYARTLKWLQQLPGETTGRVFEDNADMNELTAELTLRLIKASSSTGIENQLVSFRFRFFFKEGKLRLQASDFEFRGYFPGRSSSYYAGHYYAAQLPTDYEQHFHNLKPLTKGVMRKIYSSFDEEYLKLIRSLKKEVLNGSTSDW